MTDWQLSKSTKDLIAQIRQLARNVGRRFVPDPEKVRSFDARSNHLPQPPEER